MNDTDLAWMVVASLAAGIREGRVRIRATAPAACIENGSEATEFTEFKQSSHEHALSVLAALHRSGRGELVGGDRQ
ncbi:hypothetical protein [Nocardia sp. CA-120079]|uniref:hypothetical protein n=1 Tax=Nocardia sp. CA-120079 TaxID=3239974 RepID=UPI003D97E994